jgi:hypothetical protein
MVQKHVNAAAHRALFCVEGGKVSDIDTIPYTSLVYFIYRCNPLILTLVTQDGPKECS